MRTLTIHVGPPKTGTSAIQHVFRSNPSAPVLYPEVGLWPDGSHHGFVLNFYGDYRRPDVTRTPVEDLLESLRHQVLEDGRDILISSELLAGRADAGAFAEALGEALRGAVSVVRFVLVCREHFERTSSVYNQVVKDPFHCETEGPDTFLRRHAHAHLYGTMIRRLRDTGFDLTVLNYHPAETLVQRFAASLGWIVADQAGTVRRNVSVAVKGLVALLSLNQVVGCGPERASYFGELKRTRGFWGRSEFIFDPAVGDEAQPIFDGDRDWLKRELAVELPHVRAALRENRFVLTEPEFEQMAEALRRGGATGEAVAERMRRYVKGA